MPTNDKDFSTKNGIDVNNSFITNSDVYLDTDKYVSIISLDGSKYALAVEDNGSLTTRRESYFESIATVTLATATTDITLSSIPSTYKHLQLRIVARSTFAASAVNVSYRLNTDTNYSNYWWHVLAGNGSTAYAGQLNAATQALLQQAVAGATALTGVYGAMIVDILDYSNTSKNTTVRTFGGFDNNGSGTVGLYSSSWNNTSAVNSFTFRSWDPQWAAGTTIALYGIRG